MGKLNRLFIKLITVLIGVGVTGLLSPLLSDSYAIEQIDLSSLVQTTRQQVATLANSNKTVLKVYDSLMNTLLSAEKDGSLSSADLQRICAAIVFAAEEHKQQTRKNEEKTPYICHPLEVAYDVVKVGQIRDVSVIIGAILHDTPLDKKTHLKELNQQFGSKVASLVKEVGSHPVSAQPAQQRDLMIHAADQSVGSVQIELADLLCGVNELLNSPPSHWKKEKTDQYFEWAQSVLDRFPEANKPLQEAIAKAIQSYWDRQN